MAGRASGPLAAVQAADREISRRTALRARAVAEFAASRPASADRPAGQPDAMSEAPRVARADVLADVSEWAAQEPVAPSPSPTPTGLVARTTPPPYGASVTEHRYRACA